MTSEIEQKRKELEDDVMESSGDVTESCSCRDFAEHILEGFDLGVELARKEFLDKKKVFCEICGLEIRDVDLIQTGISKKYTHETKKGNILKNIASYHKSCYKQQLEGEKTKC